RALPRHRRGGARRATRPRAVRRAAAAGDDQRRLRAIARRIPRPPHRAHPGENLMPFAFHDHDLPLPPPQPDGDARVLWERLPLRSPDGAPDPELKVVRITLENPRQFNSYTTEMIKAV